MDKKKSLLATIKETISADTYSIKDGVITLRWGFFYTHGMTADKKAETVKAKFPSARIIDSGEVWKPFRGGTSIANSSHWYVKFLLET
jgi:hypothetical protein